MARSAEQHIQFGFDLGPQVDFHLQRAASLVGSRWESLQALYEAREAAPDQLEVLIALYKLHFYQGDTEKAEDLVYQTLIKSSRQGGFGHDWRGLKPDSAEWEQFRGPARIYLYSLKALAFIRLRQNDAGEAEEILRTLLRLDPTDQVGASVIRDLLSGIGEDAHD